MFYILLVGVANLALGFATAAAISGECPTLAVPGVRLPRLRLPTLRFRWPRWRSAAPCPAPSEAATVVEILPPEEHQFTIPTPRQTDEIPGAWLDMLDETIATNTFVEATVHVLRLEVGHYRDQLIALERALREAAQLADPETIEPCLNDLRATNRQWLEKQSEATAHLRARRDRLGELTAVGRRLESILLQQQAQIETTCNNLDYLDFLSAPALGGARLLREIARLIDLAHALRDHMLESLVAIAGQEDRLLSLNPALLRDAAFDAPNRAGLEAIFEQWRREDPGRQRALSLALVDVDRFGHFNETLGTLAGDRVLAALLQMLSECLRKNRGFDRLGRFAGQQFLVILGDTGPHEATAVVERLRQTVTATSFVLAGREVALTLRAAATDFRPQDTMETLWRRLADGLRLAGQGGGNRSVLDEGVGPALVLPPTYDVRGQIIEVAEPPEPDGDASDEPGAERAVESLAQLVQQLDRLDDAPELGESAAAEVDPGVAEFLAAEPPAIEAEPAALVADAS